jgi:excisionase family DNA binding protein
VSRVETVPKLTLSKAEAAEALSISVDVFERLVQPDIRVVRAGRRVLVPVTELVAWVERNAGLSLPGGDA